MGFLTMFFALQLGILPLGDVFMYDIPDIAVIEGSFYTYLEAGFKYQGFYISGSAKIYEWYLDNQISFTPYQLNSGLKIGWKNKNINIGAEYHCIHPVVPYYFFYHPRFKWEAFYLDVFVKIKGEVKLWK